MARGQETIESGGAAREYSRARQALSRGEKVAMASTIACGFLLAAIAPPLFRQNSAPRGVSIPDPPTLPFPNAFDVFMQAGTGVTLSPRTTLSRRPRVTRLGWLQPADPASLSSRELQTLVKANAPALQTMRRGLNFPCLYPSARATYGMWPMTAHRFRNLASAVDLEARVLAKRGDANGAMQARLDGLEFGNETLRGASIYAASQNWECQSIARRGARFLVPRLNQAQAKAAARRLEAIYARRVLFADALEEQKWCDLTMLNTMLTRPGWNPMIARGPLDRLKSSFSTPPDYARQYAAYMNVKIANARAGAPQQTVPPLSHPLLSQLPGSMVNDTEYTHNDAANALLLTALALRAFEAKNKRLPATLQELVPTYLQNVPTDPSRPGGILRYDPQPKSRPSPDFKYSLESANVRWPQER